MNVRRTIAVAVLSLGMLSLAACGEDAGSSQDSITVSATAGEAPEVTYDGDFTPTEVETSELKEGSGPEAKKDDLVLVHIWLQNAYDESVKMNTYQPAEGEAAEPAEGEAADAATEGAGEPIELLLSDEIQEGFLNAFIGKKAGSVTLTTGPANKVFPEPGYLVFGVGDEDGLVMRAELVEIKSAEERDAYIKEQKDAETAAAEEQKKAEEAAAADAEAQTKLTEAAKKNALPKAQGRPVKKAAWAPGVDYSGAVPTLDFAGKPKPTGELQITELIKGKGKKVKAGDGVAVKYVGQVFGADAPFDNSYERGEDLTFVVGAGQMIAGFDAAVEGRTVGTRLIVQIPPAQGYGEAGSEGAGIKGTDTIVFAIDVVGAS